ncbi:MAG: hypothetical protein E7056_05485 [Lentisphaerae bacterium]|nr:hypothetical protein [Lentisphaerota bacterium]
MIVPMKKVLLLALKSDQESALQELRNLGVVEVVSENLLDSADRSAQLARLNTLERVISSLKSRSAVDKGDSEAVSESVLESSVTAAFAESEDIARRLDALRKERAGIEPWGEYDPALINALAKQGIYVYLCESSLEQFGLLAEKLDSDAALEILSNVQGMCRFAVISCQKKDPSLLPSVPVAERRLSELDEDIASAMAAQSLCEDKLDKLAMQLPQLEVLLGKLRSEVELLSVRDGLADCGEIVALRGFAPAREEEKLRQAADRNAWAVILSDPEAGETVPVLLEPPRWVKPILPLFQFLGIAPGYEEFDMSPGMLIFFAIFFSMIINDAGYGLLMFAASVVAAVVLRNNRKAALPCRLALILSGCATAWGICNGAYFGTETSFMQLEFFASGEKQTPHLQLVCFVLALVHLSLGHCWRLVNASTFREVIGNLGWVPILVLDFMVVLGLLVFPGMELPAWALAAGGVGLVMVLVGGVDWRDAGAICNLPFDLIGSFTDTLSYVRLFAVGMSGTYMAQSFNDMGMDLWNASPWMIPAAVLVILFGHTLNVALACMSVLVHGVRLNTLEFSNHAGIRWGGQAFRPLKNFEK